MMTRAFACAVVIGASVLASCLSTHPTTSPPIAINVQVAPPPAASGCNQNQLTFSQSSPTSPQYVDACGDLDLSSFTGRAPVDISMSIVSSPGFGFNGGSGKDSLAYAEKHGDPKSPVSQGSRFPDGVKHGANAGDISFKYHNGHDCADHTPCPKSDYGIYLSKNGSYFGEVDPIIVNQP